jgi:hypothetical protein
MAFFFNRASEAKEELLKTVCSSLLHLYREIKERNKTTSSEESEQVLYVYMLYMYRFTSVNVCIRIFWHHMYACVYACMYGSKFRKSDQGLKYACVCMHVGMCVCVYICMQSCHVWGMCMPCFSARVPHV